MRDVLIVATLMALIWLTLLAFVAWREWLKHRRDVQKIEARIRRQMERDRLRHESETLESLRRSWKKRPVADR